jgi:hypothetical protein
MTTYGLLFSGATIVVIIVVWGLIDLGSDIYKKDH